MPGAEGVSWSWELDFDALLTALTGPAPWNRSAQRDPAPAASPIDDAAPSPAKADAAETDSAETGPAETGPAKADAAETDPAMADPVEAEFAELLEAIEQGHSQVVPLATVAGRVAESLPTGPDLAGWLATSPVVELEDGALAGMAASYRRLASWAQAGELAVVAQLASRSAASDDKIGVDEQGRPARMPEEACAQVSLALTMSQASASWWSDLAVTLNWRLAATGAALRAGQIDLGRARLIAEATDALDEETAREVEARVLPSAGDKTTSQLRAALRRAVIAADPKGAERRREEAERRAKVSLYPDQDGTASLAGYSLPSIRAAAAMARITALAKALKAAGAGGGIDLLRAHVFLGLLLGTLPYIPPAADGPPDSPPDAPPDEPPSWPPGESLGQPPGDPSPRGDRRRGGPAEGRSSPRPAAEDRDDAGAIGDADLGEPSRDRPQPQDEPPRPEDPPDPERRPPPKPPPRAGERPQPPEPPPRAGERPQPPEPPPRAEERHPPPEEPPPGDGWAGDSDDDLRPGSRPPPTWPEVRAFVPPGPAAMGTLSPAGGGLLDLQLPWSTLTGDSAEPGHLSRIGPITPAQARYLADLAVDDPAVQWRVIVTDPDGQAVAVTRVPAVSDRRDSLAGTGSPDRAGSDTQPGLVRRVTLTISLDYLNCSPASDLPMIGESALRAASLAADRASRQAEADAAAADGCAHEQASLAYRPPPRLREYVVARDVTCRFPTCRQPVWRCDLDHSVPYDRGGRTCSCNLGGLCRFHHQVKQHRRWQLSQSAPGIFTWITPAGRAYRIEPDRHAA